MKTLNYDIDIDDVVSALKHTRLDFVSAAENTENFAEKSDYYGKAHICNETIKAIDKASEVLADCANLSISLRNISILIDRARHEADTVEDMIKYEKILTRLGRTIWEIDFLNEAVK